MGPTTTRRMIAALAIRFGLEFAIACCIVWALEDFDLLVGFYVFLAIQALRIVFWLLDIFIFYIIFLQVERTAIEESVADTISLRHLPPPLGTDLSMADYLNRIIDDEGEDAEARIVAAELRGATVAANQSHGLIRTMFVQSAQDSGLRKVRGF